MGKHKTILYHYRNDEYYHFYYDKESGTYELEFRNKESHRVFLERIGKILEECPLSDVSVSIKHRPVCPLLE